MMCFAVTLLAHFRMNALCDRWQTQYGSGLGGLLEDYIACDIASLLSKDFNIL